MRPSLFGNRHRVGQVGQPAHAEPQSRHRPVIHLEGLKANRPTGPGDLKGPVNGAQVQNGWIGAARRLHEGIGKARKQRLLRRRIRPNGQPLAQVKDDLAQIIDAMHVVGMRMGIDHRIQCADTGIQKLVAHVGRGVDQDPRYTLAALAFHQHRTAATAVLGVHGVAVAPVAPQPWHPARRPASQNGKAQRGHVTPPWPTRRPFGTDGQNWPWWRRQTRPHSPRTPQRRFWR